MQAVLGTFQVVANWFLFDLPTLSGNRIIKHQIVQSTLVHAIFMKIKALFIILL